MDGVSSLAAMALTIAGVFLLPSLVDRRALRNAVVVAFPDHCGIRWQSEKPFDGFPADMSVKPKRSRGVLGELPYLDVAAPINPRPDADDILSTPDTQDHPAYLFTCLCELVANDAK